MNDDEEDQLASVTSAMVAALKPCAAELPVEMTTLAILSALGLIVQAQTGCTFGQAYAMIGDIAGRLSEDPPVH